VGERREEGVKPGGGALGRRCRRVGLGGVLASAFCYGDLKGRVDDKEEAAGRIGVFD